MEGRFGWAEPYMMIERRADSFFFLAGWETYIPYIVQGAEVTPQLRAFLDSFRERIMNGFVGQGKLYPNRRLAGRIRY